MTSRSGPTPQPRLSRQRLVLIAAGLAATAAPTAAPAPALAQGAGTAATVVLRLAPGPRALALGNALVAVPDAQGVEYNPALAGGSASGFVASYQALPVDASAGAATATFRLPVGALAISTRFVDYGVVDEVVEQPGAPVGEPTGGTASGGELTALLGWAVNVGIVRAGLAARWLRMDVAGERDAALAGDAGILVEPLPWIGLGLALQNLGGELEAGRAAPLPRTLRAGVRIERPLGPIDALLAVEGRHREERIGYGIGIELGGGGPTFRAAGRIGWESRPRDGDAYSHAVFGGGVRVDRIGVDFAYRSLGPLGTTRQFGLSYAF